MSMVMSTIVIAVVILCTAWLGLLVSMRRIARKPQGRLEAGWRWRTVSEDWFVCRCGVVHEYYRGDPLSEIADFYRQRDGHMRSCGIVSIPS